MRRCMTVLVVLLLYSFDTASADTVLLGKGRQGVDQVRMPQAFSLCEKELFASAAGKPKQEWLGIRY